MSANEKTKKQHYVPQFYLRQWTDPSGCFYPLKVENKTPPQLKIFSNKTTTSNFCFENFFYAQYTGKEDEISQKVEKAFTELEGIFSKELPKLEAKILNYEQITDWDKYHLAEFMLFLWIRGKKHRQESQKMSEYMAKEINKHIAYFSNKDPKMKADMEKTGITRKEMIEFAEKGEYSVDFGNMHHMQLLKDLPGFCNLLSAKFWRAYISKDGEFIATDVPYRDVSLSKEFFGNDFLSREQSFILSPRVLLVASYPKNKGGKNFVRKDITGQRVPIQTINCHSLMNSMMFGFHKDKALLEELSKFASEIYKLRTQNLI